MGRDKDRTKTSEDRLVELCSRARAVLERQLALHETLRRAGVIRHEAVFFKETGDPIQNLQYPWVRWRSTLQRLNSRYREPYNARHSSVTWNLMIGKNPLWVAKQHGHSVQTMLLIYAAWIEGAQESDIEAIKVAMQAQTPPSCGLNTPPKSPEFGNHLAIREPNAGPSYGEPRELSGGERGIRTLEGLLTLTPLAGVRLRPLGHLSASP